MTVEVSGPAAETIRSMREDPEAWRGMLYEAYSVEAGHIDETEDWSEAGLRPLRAIRELDTLFNELIKDK